MAGLRDGGAVAPLFSSAADLRSWVKADLTGDAPTDAAVDAELLRLALAFQLLADAQLGRPVMSRVLELALDGFPACGSIDLRTGGVSAVAISYSPAAGGAAVALPAAGVWELDTFVEPPCVRLLDGATWPATTGRRNCVVLSITAGWSDGAAVPAPVKTWILAHVADHFRNREATSDRPVTALPYLSGLLDPYRVIIFP